GPEELAEIRERELQHAAAELGIADLRHFRYPDGGLAAAPRRDLEALVVAAIEELRPLLMVTFGRTGISGHSDHITACDGALAGAAARAWGTRRDLAPPPGYGWAMPERIATMLAERLGRQYAVTPEERIVSVAVGEEDLAAQWRAVQHHRSQHQPPPWPFQIRC